MDNFPSSLLIPSSALLSFYAPSPLYLDSLHDVTPSTLSAIFCPAHCLRGETSLKAIFHWPGIYHHPKELRFNCKLHIFSYIPKVFQIFYLIVREREERGALILCPKAHLRFSPKRLFDWPTFCFFSFSLSVLYQ